MYNCYANILYNTRARLLIARLLPLGERTSNDPAHFSNLTFLWHHLDDQQRDLIGEVMLGPSWTIPKRFGSPHLEATHGLLKQSIVKRSASGSGRCK